MENDKIERPGITEIVVTLQEFYKTPDGKRAEIVRPYVIKAVLSDDEVGDIPVYAEEETVKQLACQVLQQMHNDIQTGQKELV